MTRPTESLFHMLLDAMAATGAEMLTEPGENRRAMYLTLMSIFYAKAANVAGGEWVYVPGTNRIDREQARSRIVLALQAGEAPTQIAKKEGVTERHVRKLRGTLRP